MHAYRDDTYMEVAVDSFGSALDSITGILDGVMDDTWETYVDGTARILVVSTTLTEGWYEDFLVIRVSLPLPWLVWMAHTHTGGLPERCIGCIRSNPLLLPIIP